MHLVDDIYFIITCLWGKPYLFYQSADIINRVITCSIEFMNIQ